MKAAVARAAVAGALLLTAAPLASPSSAMTCGELASVCSAVCNSTTVTYKICSQLG